MNIRTSFPQQILLPYHIVHCAEVQQIFHLIATSVLLKIAQKIEYILQDVVMFDFL